MLKWKVRRLIDLSGNALDVERLKMLSTLSTRFAHELRISVQEDKADADLAGLTVKLSVILPDKSSMMDTFDGTIDGSTVIVTLPSICYSQTGEVRVVLYLANDSGGLLPIYAFVLRNFADLTDIFIDTSNVIPSISEILNEVQKCTSATAAANSAADAANTSARSNPYINTSNNHWMSWDAETGAYRDTGVSATGPQGPAGKNGVNGQTPYIGGNGNWWIGGEDTGTRAQGPSGTVTEEAIPDYWQAHLDARVADIRAAMAVSGWEKSAFLWYHDVHWTYGFKRAPMLLKYLYQHTPINRTNFGGDVIDAEGDDTTTMAYLWDWRAEVRDLPNHHSVPGNHDDGNTIDNRFDDPYIYAYLLAAEETPDVVRGDSGLYYYIDVPAERTRYLYLDTATADGNILHDTAQQSWLKQTLLNTPEDWHIVAIAHIWRTYDSSFVDNAWGYGAKVALDMFDAYNARTGEFAAGRGRVEFCIGGHTHVDADHTTEGGIPVILTEGDSRYVRSGLDCIEGTITEASVNAIIADYANGKVSVIRVGRGSSRVVMLDGSDAPEEPDGGDEGGGNTPDIPPVNYTNQLPISTDTDGSIYNGKGFKENTRISTSSKTETSATGWCLTGCIRAGRNDVIRMKNVTFMDINNAATTDRTQVYYYDANRAYYNNSNVYSPDSPMNAEWSPVFGDNGDIVQFTIPATFDSNVVYIRICAKHIDASSVITVNEEID